MNAAHTRRLKFASLMHLGMTATKAASQCGYKDPEKAGWRLSKDVRVCQEIARLQANLSLVVGSAFPPNSIVVYAGKQDDGVTPDWS